jgi:hypothetical protein
MTTFESPTTRCLAFLTLAALCSACATMAPPPPLATFGGPETTPRGQSELALAAGSAVIRFPSGHATGQGWFGRWRHGVTDRLDLGVDVQGVQHNDNSTFAVKAAARYGLLPRLRLEVGVGAADDAAGKSLNADTALTVGTRHDDADWNYYASLRIAGARGYPGRACCGSGATGDVAPPDSRIALGAIGATARVGPNMRFILEGGHGFTWVKGQRDHGNRDLRGDGAPLDGR